MLAVLGPVAVEGPSGAVPVPGRKTREVLALLALAASFFASYGVLIQPLALLTVVVTLLIIAMGTVGLFKGYRPARYFMHGRGAVESTRAWQTRGERGAARGARVQPASQPRAAPRRSDRARTATPAPRRRGKMSRVNEAARASQGIEPIAGPVGQRTSTDVSCWSLR